MYMYNVRYIVYMYVCRLRITMLLLLPFLSPFPSIVFHLSLLPPSLSPSSFLHFIHPSLSPSLVHQLRDNRNLKINVVLAPNRPLSSFQPETSLHVLRRYGLTDLILDMIDAPEPILAFYCQFHHLHQVPLAQDLSPQQLQKVSTCTCTKVHVQCMYVYVYSVCACRHSLLAA